MQRDKFFVYDWMTDRQERLRLAFWQNGTEYQIMHQAIGSKKWETLWKFESFADDQVWPMGFGQDAETLYVNAYHEGRRAIFKVNINDPGLRKELVFSDSNYDVYGSLVYSKITGGVIGARVSGHDGVTFWDEDYKNLQKSVDMSLPGMHGLDVKKQLAEQSITASIPVVALTAAAMTREVDAAMEAGFSDYLTKPVRLARLKEVVDKLLTRN